MWGRSWNAWGHTLIYVDDRARIAGGRLAVDARPAYTHGWEQPAHKREKRHDKINKLTTRSSPYKVGAQDHIDTNLLAPQSRRWHHQYWYEGWPLRWPNLHGFDGIGEGHEEHGDEREEHKGEFGDTNVHKLHDTKIGLLSTARNTIPIESRGKDRDVQSHEKDWQEDGRICDSERIATQVESERKRPSTTRITTRERPNPWRGPWYNS
jgi:hypothetical protein